MDALMTFGPEVQRNPSDRTWWMLRNSRVPERTSVLRFIHFTPEVFSPMGLSFSSLYGSLSSLLLWNKEKDVRILMLGLDSAGKVTASVHFLNILTHNSPSDHYSVQAAGMSVVFGSNPGV
jgi:hypothetical protein